MTEIFKININIRVKSISKLCKKKYLREESSLYIAIDYTDFDMLKNL